MATGYAGFQEHLDLTRKLLKSTFRFSKPEATTNDACNTYVCVSGPLLITTNAVAHLNAYTHHPARTQLRAHLQQCRSECGVQIFDITAQKNYSTAPSCVFQALRVTGSNLGDMNHFQSVIVTENLKFD